MGQKGKGKGGGGKTKPCKYFQQGNCRFGNNCKFLHNSGGGGHQQHNNHNNNHNNHNNNHNNHNNHSHNNGSIWNNNSNNSTNVGGPGFSSIFNNTTPSNIFNNPHTAPSSVFATSNPQGAFTGISASNIFATPLAHTSHTGISSGNIFATPSTPHNTSSVFASSNPLSMSTDSVMGNTGPNTMTMGGTLSTGNIFATPFPSTTSFTDSVGGDGGGSSGAPVDEEALKAFQADAFTLGHIPEVEPPDHLR
eukprot:TRINITY_DN1038_c0_g1_i1.p1 TRINITY_DN1038_c0_g1~~TRINITY_DN1038_c0_g1_i1.p1  ORF type:complete len:250 (-),score=76.41 TRINITY_DN1038_c0_g1_i1:44-793(-)